MLHDFRNPTLRLSSLSNENRGHSVENEQHAPQDRHEVEVSSAGSDIKTVI